jgi:hypothetical protein
MEESTVMARSISTGGNLERLGDLESPAEG